MPKIEFTEDTYEERVAGRVKVASKGDIMEVKEASAQRWEIRGKAVRVKSEIEKVSDRRHEQATAPVPPAPAWNAPVPPAPFAPGVMTGEGPGKTETPAPVPPVPPTPAAASLAPKGGKPAKGN